MPSIKDIIKDAEDGTNLYPDSDHHSVINAWSLYAIYIGFGRDFKKLNKYIAIKARSACNELKVKWMSHFIEHVSLPLKDIWKTASLLMCDNLHLLLDHDSKWTETTECDEIDLGIPAHMINNKVCKSLLRIYFSHKHRCYPDRLYHIRNPARFSDDVESSDAYKIISSNLGDALGLQKVLEGYLPWTQYLVIIENFCRIKEYNILIRHAFIAALKPQYASILYDILASQYRDQLILQLSSSNIADVSTADVNKMYSIAQEELDLNNEIKFTYIPKFAHLANAVTIVCTAEHDIADHCKMYHSYQDQILCETYFDNIDVITMHYCMYHYGHIAGKKITDASKIPIKFYLQYMPSGLMELAQHVVNNDMSIIDIRKNIDDMLAYIKDLKNAGEVCRIAEACTLWYANKIVSEKCDIDQCESFPDCVSLRFCPNIDNLKQLYHENNLKNVLLNRGEISTFEHIFGGVPIIDAMSLENPSIMHGRRYGSYQYYYLLNNLYAVCRTENYNMEDWHDRNVLAYSVIADSYIAIHLNTSRPCSTMIKLFAQRYEL